MRRVPVDEEFGPPIATLSNSPIALFENGTIAKISVKDENEKQLCKIEVEPLPRTLGGEIWAKTKTYGNEAFFYRTSDTTTPASALSAVRYISQTFNRRTIDDEFEKSLDD